MSKKYVFLIGYIALLGCNTPSPKSNPFQDYLRTLPYMDLPLETNSNEELSGKVAYDSTFRAFNPSQAPVWGKTQLNDSIFAILFLEVGDAVYPRLVTYNAQGEKIDSELLLHLPGGSSGYLQNGTSHLRLDKNLQITIMDSIHTFTRDRLDNIVPESTITSTKITRFYALPDGQIQEQKP